MYMYTKDMEKICDRPILYAKDIWEKLCHCPILYTKNVKKEELYDLLRVGFYAPLAAYIAVSRTVP